MNGPQSNKTEVVLDLVETNDDATSSRAINGDQSVSESNERKVDAFKLNIKRWEMGSQSFFLPTLIVSDTSFQGSNYQR